MSTVADAAGSEREPRASVAAPGWDAWLRLALLVPVLVFAAYLAIGLHGLRVGHPMEDAYILFKYVENVAAGHGFVFNPGGPRAEGATDFLWLSTLAGLASTGIDVAVAALALNAFGAALASGLCVHAIRASSVRGPWALVLALLSTPVILVGGALAGYAGFGAMLYSALAVALVSLSLHARRALAWLPPLGLVAGLFRADGVVLGVAHSVLGFVLARPAGVIRRYACAAAFALAAGAAYYAWRLHHFGLALPLPLYVKDNTVQDVGFWAALARPREHFSGLDVNLSWLASDLGPARLLAAGLVFALVAGRAARPGRVAALLVPSLLLLAALCLVRQSQNFAYRFQAPVYLACFYAAFWLAVRACERVRTGWLRALACALLATALLPSATQGASRLRQTWRLRSYMDTFPALLAGVLRPGRTVALTDAGRLPFWVDARFEDLVGLNTPRFALAAPTLADLEALDPDVLMFNVADVFDYGELESGVAALVPLDRRVLAEAVSERFREAFEGGPVPAGRFSIRENVAPLVMGRYLCGRDGYDLYAVEHRGQHVHVWGFRSGMEELPAIRRALEDTASGRVYGPYLELRRARREALR